MTAYVRSTAVWTVYRSGAWEMGQLRGSAVHVGNQQVVGPRTAAISAPDGGTTVDLEARAALGQVLASMRQHGLIET
jgi:hypothetical protein